MLDLYDKQLIYAPTFTAVIVAAEFVSCITGAVVIADCVMTMHFTSSIVGRALINICHYYSIYIIFIEAIYRQWCLPSQNAPFPSKPSLHKQT